MTEEWRRTTCGEKDYFVSDQGRVRHRNKLCEGSIDCTGRRIVTLDDGAHRVHIMVLELFRGRCPAGLKGVHRNGDLLDNRLQNLMWGSVSRLTPEDVADIRAAIAKGEETLTEIAKRKKVSRAAISQINVGRTWK